MFDAVIRIRTHLHFRGKCCKDRLCTYSKYVSAFLKWKYVWRELPSNVSERAWASEDDLLDYKALETIAGIKNKSHSIKGRGILAFHI